MYYPGIDHRKRFLQVAAAFFPIAILDIVWQQAHIYVEASDLCLKIGDAGVAWLRKAQKEKEAAFQHASR